MKNAPKKPMGILESFFNKKPDGLLYHYTSVSGLLGIVKSKSIWATHVAFLNDSSEFTHAIALMRSTIKKRKKDANSIEKGFYDNLLDALNILSEDMSGFNMFVCSFSENGDVLSQWRGYCPNGGYSIGFDFRYLERAIRAHKFTVKIGKCIYNKSEHEQIISEILAKTIDSYKKYVNRLRKDKSQINADFYFKDFIAPLLRIAPFIKNISFREEQEWRMIASVTDNDKVEFREGVNWIIPYYRLELPVNDDILDINQIIIGPAVQAEIAILSLKSLLKKDKVRYKNIIKSKIPFRR